MAVVVDSAYHIHTAPHITEFSPQGFNPLAKGTFNVFGPELNAALGSVCEIEVFGPELDAVVSLPIVIISEMEVFGPACDFLLQPISYITGDMQVFGPILDADVKIWIGVIGDIEVFGPILDADVIENVIVNAEFLGPMLVLTSTVSVTLAPGSDRILLKHNQDGSNWETFA